MELQQRKLVYFHLHGPKNRGRREARTLICGPGAGRPREFKALFSGSPALRAPLEHQGGPGASPAGRFTLRLPLSPWCSPPALRRLAQRSGASAPAFTPPTAISPGVSGTRGPARGSLRWNNQCHVTEVGAKIIPTPTVRARQVPPTPLLLAPGGKQTVSAPMPSQSGQSAQWWPPLGAWAQTLGSTANPAANYARPTPGPHPTLQRALGPLGPGGGTAPVRPPPSLAPLWPVRVGPENRFCRNCIPF